ncbi:hypothetical protein FGG08_006212 [Glutinoglossum americanum]|uniref:Cytochrome b5 heme-binding domain-containing protein n=1 Tax=Glutinoglossum americanum TaxID=1670608 RepID=A0A9P8L135_9PEZI|nr:hypothetical protein FGG08_006212 [Glutinoglossum americanum]
MVLVGISVLVASISFLVYRHQPTWPSIFNFLSQIWRGRRLEVPGNISEPKTTAGHYDECKALTTHTAAHGKLPVEQEAISDSGLLGACNTPPSPPTGLETSQITQRNSPSIPSLNLDESSSSDDDSPPSFPSKYSAQRASPVTNPSRQAMRPTHTTQHPAQAARNTPMAPPPRPTLTPSNIRARDPPSGLGLSVPVGAGSLPVKSSGNSLALPPTATQKPAKPRKKVLLTPGHSPLDWARLQTSGVDLRGLPHPHLLRVPPSQLRLHNKRTSAWSALGGKVYNITPYLPFHPGGERELMKAAGRDGTKLFMEIHPWVNWDTMLGECLIGMAVDEGAVGAIGGNGDHMDIVGKKWEDMD